MIAQMQHIDCKGKKVFDFGTGTGILAILAHKLGASNIWAIDNDEWAYENTIENIERNDCTGIKALHSTLEELPESGFDIILANINRHILLMYMQQLSDKLVEGGILLMSGLLVADRDVILQSAGAAGFVLLAEDENSNWIMLKMGKKAR